VSYTVAEVSKIVNLSKASIYNKLKSKDFKDHITKKQGVTFLDEIALDLIKSDIKSLKEDINYLNDKQTDNTLECEVATDTEFINYLKEDINYLKLENEKLWTELKVKNTQIHELNERLKQEQELTKNMQILQLRQQPQDIKVLEEHFQDLDNKLLQVREQMQERKNQEKKGLFNRIFK
jgi:septal ring factor EnvC (AmiA/AmiB activator)